MSIVPVNNNKQILYSSSSRRKEGRKGIVIAQQYVLLCWCLLIRASYDSGVFLSLRCLR
jgi:hypothetical protein